MGCTAALILWLGVSEWAGNFCFFKFWAFNAFIFEKIENTEAPSIDQHIFYAAAVDPLRMMCTQITVMYRHYL